MLFRTFILLLTVSFWLGAAQAKTYKWVDADGITIYSQTPPLSGEASEIKPPPPVPSNPKPETEQSKPAPAAKVKQRKEDMAVSESIRKQNCASAKHNFQLYESLAGRLMKTPDGLYKRLSEEERQEKVEAARNQIKEFCKDKK